MQVTILMIMIFKLCMQTRHAGHHTYDNDLYVVHAIETMQTRHASHFSQCTHDNDLVEVHACSRDQPQASAQCVYDNITFNTWLRAEMGGKTYFTETHVYNCDISNIQSHS